MPYYKEKNGNMHFLENAEFKNLLPVDCIEVDEQEAQAIIEAAKPTAAQLRKWAIAIELEKIDTDSARPARAVAVALAAGQEPNAFDLGKLQGLEAKAAALRAEIKTL